VDALEAELIVTKKVEVQLCNGAWCCLLHFQHVMQIFTRACLAFLQLY
jgi:hypothetical protein